MRAEQDVSSPQGNATNLMCTTTAYLFTYVSSPQGNATNPRGIPQGLRLFFVSSPQGNATNVEGICKIEELKDRFKSPRECYKHPVVLREMIVIPSCFKSPRECYKPESNRLLKLHISRFQVPKGMLQTIKAFEEKPEYYYCFKSPRECYKLLFTPPPIRVRKIRFQVPKGMLQTFFTRKSLLSR